MAIICYEKTNEKWIDSGEHLPAFMRDFHDQKDLFKAVEKVMGKQEEPYGVNWVAGRRFHYDHVFKDLKLELQKVKKNGIDWVTVDALFAQCKKDNETDEKESSERYREDSDSGHLTAVHGFSDAYDIMEKMK
jgi:hypothetical protein